MVCPLCGSSATQVYEHPEADLYRCPDCDHCFADQGSIADREGYTSEYGEEDHKNWFENPNFALFEKIDQELSRRRTTSVLDLGCGRGDLLKYLSDRHPDWTLAGVEWTDYGNPYDLDIAATDIEALELGEEFDAVVSLAVIEHLEDPVAFLERMATLCNSTGSIVVMMLNERSVLYAAARAMRTVGPTGPFDQLYSKHHLHHFNKTSLATAARAADLTIDRRIDHNIPAAAIDFESQGSLADAVRRTGTLACFGLGRLTGRTYLQTIVCRPIPSMAGQTDETEITGSTIVR